MCQIKDKCLDGVCRNFIFGKCKKTSCKWQHPTAKELFKKFKSNGAINEPVMKCNKLPFCIWSITGKCNKGTNCIFKHVNATELVAWLKAYKCLTIDI